MQSPAAVDCVVQGKCSHIKRMFVPWPSSSPRLECSSFARSRLPVEIKGIEHQRLASCIEDAAKRFPCFSITINIEHVGNIEVSGAHQFAYILIGSSEFF